MDTYPAKVDLEGSEWRETFEEACCMNHIDVAIIGAGQTGLSVAYFLRRSARSFVLLDDQAAAGGAWQHGWPSLRLFSPASWSSIAGWPMPPNREENPTASDVVNYLEAYERRYRLDVRRSVKVQAIDVGHHGLLLRTDKGDWSARAVVSATGTWSHPHRATYPGLEQFEGVQLHSADYRGASDFAGRRVLVVGGGNSGAQIFSEVSNVAYAQWVTIEEPRFLPDDVDGRVLFERATERWRALQEGRTVIEPQGGLGDIVMVPPVKEARARGVLHSVRPFKCFAPRGVVWPDGTEEAIDVVIWCTGFRPALHHLESLGLVESDGRVEVNGTRSVRQPRLWLVGYGDWTGIASATLIGVMRTARSTALEIDAALAAEQKGPTG